MLRGVSAFSVLQSLLLHTKTAKVFRGQQKTFDQKGEVWCGYQFWSAVRTFLSSRFLRFCYVERSFIIDLQFNPNPDYNAPLSAGTLGPPHR